MNVVIQYGVAGLILVIIVRTYYSLYTRDYFVRGKKFDLVLRIATGVIITSLILTIADVNIEGVPLWILIILSELQLVLIEAFILSIYWYILSLAGHRQKRSWKQGLWEWIPSIVMVGLFVSSIWNGWLFYFDDTITYHVGDYQYMIYFYMFYIMILLVYTLAHQFHWTRGGKKASLIMIIIILGLSAFCERYLPGRAMSSYFIGIGVLILFFEAQGPLSHRDSLTGLRGRCEMEKIIRNNFKENKPFSTAVVALDGFKTINSIYGTSKSDQLLVAITQYIRELVPEPQICRFAGDVFLITLPREINEAELQQEYKRCFKQEWEIEGQIIRVDACILCINFKDCADEEDLISTIDFILPVAKAIKKNNLVFVDEQLKAEVKKSARIEDLLREALETDGLEVYYQPIFDARTNQIWAAEALVRLKDHQGKYIPPDEFVVIAERQGYIEALGEIVLDKTCTFIETYNLKAMGIDHIDVNLSVVQCLNPNLPNRLMSIMEEHHVKPSEIVFEITETAHISSFLELEVSLRAIKDRGMQIALDDFGMGYANLQYMTQLPFSVVKFDKELLWDAYKDPKIAIVLEEMAILIRKLNAYVICEGAETAEHVQFLLDLKIYIIQGYFYGKPVPEQEFVTRYLPKKIKQLEIKGYEIMETEIAELGN